MNSKEKKLYLALICLAAAIIIALLAYFLIIQPGKRTKVPVLLADVDNRSVFTESRGIASEESVFDTAIMQGELNDMGTLITAEYYFTEVVTFTSTKKLFNIDIGFTESSYIAGYEGHATAGIDFSQITVSADNETKILTVYLPKATIQDVVIDPNSFKLYSEKEGFANHISVNDFNQSLIELNTTAEEKAIEKGILERADENAKNVISSFIAGTLDTDEYEIAYVNS